MRRLFRRIQDTYFTSALSRLVRVLPLRALLPLGLAIFTLFSTLGWMTDVLNGARAHPAVLLINGAMSGMLGVAYAFGSMRRKWWLFALAIGINVLYSYVGKTALDAFPSIPLADVPQRLKLDAAGTLASVTLSYACFLWFINGTAARYLSVQAEIALAREIHQVLVPVVNTRAGGFEFYGVSQPSGEVGGDLVDVVTTGGKGGWFGYIADVSGHGVSSGVVMGMFKSALRMRLLHGGPISALLGDLNTVLFPLKSGSMFVTAACVRATEDATAADGTLEFAVAGHLPILRVRGRLDVEEITTPQIPIGMFEDYPFVSATLHCRPGDLLALITDGLTEVFDAGDEELGMEPVKHVLRESATLPLPQVAERIIAAARAHGAQLDDQTLLLIRRA